MKKLLFPALLLLPFLMLAQPKIQLVNFASGFNLPVDIANCGDSRMFVVERDGVIWVLDSLGNRLDTFLNINPRVNSTQNEQGLLGLVFDPNYAENGYFYVDYTKNGAGDTRVARFSVKTNNPNEADPNSELTIIEQSQPYWNHNGGCLRFGPDGFLYISLGDGGNGGDPQNYGQSKQTFLGKILRIDVQNSNASAPYVVPASNPFVNDTQYKPEIWSTGWRNPWRFSFDELTGDMWIADVGQNLWEEVDFEPANTGGLNYGWRCYEGTHTYNTTGCQPASAYVSPFFEYSHSGGNGCSVTGGYIYRGSKYPDLYGCYLFADYCSGRWWYTRRNADGSFTTSILANLGGYEFSTFGVDRDGELYVALLSSGKVQKIRELCSPFQVSGTAGPAVCANASDGIIELNTTGATGATTYTWSTGASTQNLSNLGPGIYSVEVKDANNCIRRDTFEIGNASPATPELNQIDTTVCLGQSIQFNLPPLPPAHIYQWYQDGQLILAPPNGELVPTATATYQVQVVNQHCSSALSSPVLVTVFPNPVISLELLGGDTLFANVTPGNAAIQWFFEDILLPNATAPFLVADQTGVYSVLVTDLVGCQSSAEIQVEVSAARLPAFLRKFLLAPNPATNSVQLEIELEKTERAVISISDNAQKQVYTRTLSGQKIMQTIDLSNLPAGAYLLRVESASGSVVRKLVKQ